MARRRKARRTAKQKAATRKMIAANRKRHKKGSPLRRSRAHASHCTCKHCS